MTITPRGLSPGSFASLLKPNKPQHMISKIGKIRLYLSLPLYSLIATPAESATNWDRVQTGGGCYTPTVVFSEIQQGLAYARTDVAGAYRWDNATSQWVSLLDSTTWTESH